MDTNPFITPVNYQYFTALLLLKDIIKHVMSILKKTRTTTAALDQLLGKINVALLGAENEIPDGEEGQRQRTELRNECANIGSWLSAEFAANFYSLFRYCECRQHVVIVAAEDTEFTKPRGCNLYYCPDPEVFDGDQPLTREYCWENVQYLVNKSMKQSFKMIFHGYLGPVYGYNMYKDLCIALKLELGKNDKYCGELVDSLFPAPEFFGCSDCYVPPNKQARTEEQQEDMFCLNLLFHQELTLENDD